VTTVQDPAPATAQSAQALLVVSGLGGCRAVAARIDSALRRGATNMVVDFDDIGTIDATSLTTLHRHAKRLRERGDRVSVVCEHRGLSGPLHLTVLDRAFDVFPAQDEALLTRP
jgi:anti-anti-sigma factor